MPCRFAASGPELAPHKRVHHRLLVIGLLVLEIDFGVERSGEIGGQIARILRADGDTGAEGPAFAGEVFEMLAAWPRATPRPARAGA